MFLLTESTTSLLNLGEAGKTSKNDLPALPTTDEFPLVLVVDEDEDTRLMMKYLLNLWNYRIAEAADSSEAFETAKILRPDLILVSDKLARIDGLTTIRRIRELSELDNTIVIFINGYSEPAVHASALAVGADDYMSKPIDFGCLETKLKHYLKKDKKRNG